MTDGTTAAFPTTSVFNSDQQVGTDEYEEFIFVLAPTILAIAIVMCCARLLFVYCSYRRCVESSCSKGVK